MNNILPLVLIVLNNMPLSSVRHVVISFVSFAITHFITLVKENYMSAWCWRCVRSVNIKSQLKNVSHVRSCIVIRVSIMLIGEGEQDFIRIVG
jgi:hypothetical protein